MKRFWVLFGVVLLMLYSFTGFVRADPTGATVTAGTAVTGSGTTSDNITINAGEVMSANIYGKTITTKWAGFYGNISGGISLEDSSGNVFYNWSVSDVTGAVVYAANDTVSDWTLSNASEADMPAYVQGTATDSFSNTFTASEQFTSPTKTVDNVLYAVTYGTGTFKTYALKTTSEIIFAGKSPGTAAGFNGNNVDYQILVPAQSNTNYYFYLELP
ncbi:MAG: hypothetical protein PWP03_809 [Candidatus Woesearchaeota archaeon]|nr:hypothetical protein [Candidatus Woesearchaeota archaeon]MDN5328171.1 hypothetical protein [Candidatus Woesearchaeota archaeon]